MEFERDQDFQAQLVEWLIEQISIEPTRADSVFEAILKLGVWKVAARNFGNMSRPTRDITLSFQSHWLTSGHRIRKQIFADEETAKLLRKMMPGYLGPDKILYRGESKWNWDNGQIGFCWTDKLEVAKMFAGGWHNSEFGAVVIKGEFPSSSIIAGVEQDQTHNIKDEESEFTIDPFCDVMVEAIECHGPYDDTGNHKPNWPLPEVLRRKCQQ